MTTSLEDPSTAWHSPSYHITDISTPTLSCHTALQVDSDFLNNFPRKARWCADGSSLIVQCENRTFQSFEMRVSSSSLRPELTSRHADRRDAPSDNTPTGGAPSITSTSLRIAHANTFPQPASIVDFVWYPGASRYHLPGYCFVASVRDCPIKLLDGRDGRLRASYPIVDHRERYVAPHSLAFNLSADKLYCGFEDAIEIFDVQRPGEGDRLPTTPSKKSKDGLKGIISALAFSYSPGYYAAGSLTMASSVSDNIALFTESAFEPVLSIGGVAGWEKGGVTQLMFNPTRPHILYAAFRRSERIWSWDLRGDASAPLSCFSSNGEVASSVPRHKNTNANMTNQRMQFDIESAGKWLASGNQAGAIAMYDLDVENDGHGEGSIAAEETETTTRQTRPTLMYDAHGDAVGAVSFHPLKPSLLSVSGSRHFDDEASDPVESDSEDSDSGSESESVKSCVVVTRLREGPQPSVRDASIKLWDFGEAERT